LLCCRGALLLGLGERLEASFIFEPGYALRAGLEIETKRAFDGDLAVAEMRRRENSADDNSFPISVLRHETGVALFVVSEDFQDVLLAFDRNFAALVAEALAHLSPERRRRRIDKLYATLSRARLSVRHDPDVSGDAGVVEELLRQRDERFEQ